MQSGDDGTITHQLRDALYESVWWWRDATKRGSKYERWYDDLIEKALKRGPLHRGERELHHIVPKVFGGKDGLTVHLTFREHFVAHLLLAAITKPGPRQKMLYALGCMTRGNGRRKSLTSWEYERSRRAQAEALRDRWDDKEFRLRHRAAVSAATSLLWQNPEYRTFMSAAASASASRRWEDPEYRASMTGKDSPLQRLDSRLAAAVSHRIKWQDPEYKASRSGDNHATKRPEVRAKLSAAHTAIADQHWTKSEKGRVKRSKSQSGLWQDPEYRAKQSISRTEGQRRRRAREAENGGSPNRPDVAGDRNPMRNPKIVAKMSDKLRGIIRSEETRAKLRAAWIRRKSRQQKDTHQ